MPAGNFIERSLMGGLSFLKEAIFSDECAAKNAFLQKLSPRIKVLSVLLLILAVMFSRSIIFLSGLYAFCLLLAIVSLIHLGFFLKRTWVFIPLFSLCIAIPVLIRGDFISAGFFFLRVLISVSLCALLALTTKHFALLKALRVFKIPQIFVMTLGMCYRYVYLFIDLIQNTYSAIKSRVGYVSGVKTGQGIVAWNMSLLWQRSYAMHNEVYQAMLSRGYSGEPKVMDEPRSSFKDWLFLTVAILIFGLSLWQK